MRTLLSLACAALMLGASSAQDLVVRAGTIYPCGGGDVLTNGAAIWIQGGKIKAIGKDVPAPVGTPELDYGMGAVIAPGLVSTRSGYGSGVDSARAAAPFVQAIDNYNPYATYYSALRAGVTTVFLEPGKTDRLIAGQGAVVKMAGDDNDARILTRSTGLVGSVASNARFSPGFWEPRLPATADIGLGFENRQFPRTVMGAVVALKELIAFARGDGNFADEYGTPAGEVLGELIQQGAPWRLRAETDEEVAALIELFAMGKMPLVIEGLERAPDSAALLARANYPVIYQVTEPSLQDFGKDPDAERPSTHVAANLKKNGVAFAIQGWSPTSLRFAAGLAMRGGLDSQTALDGITYRAAEALGVANRVGSLQVGRDGDLAVFNGSPLDAGASVLATLIDGKVVYDAREVDAKRKAFEAKQASGTTGQVGPLVERVPVTTVVSVQELHLGDGEVLRPGELLMRDGRIVEVGARVSRPAGAVVVQGFAAMPGVVDVLGHLGMEGADPRFSKTFDMKRMLEPGDWLDREVAMAGTTTVNLTSRSQPLETATLVYKPAGVDVDAMVVRDQGALLMSWPNGSTAANLAKLAKYNEDWDAYEKALAEWEKNPPAPEPEKTSDKDKKDEEAKKEESSEEGDKKDDDGKKKKKKSKDKPEAVPVTGAFEAQVTLAGKEDQKFRLRLLEGEAGALEGTLRMGDFPDLVLLDEQRKAYEIRLDAMTVEGG
ncbi:MAG TPA: amidohydrolase family protein, partial [Planctomycetota bacterium]|nr:amidohydrolase family protein [Planctomycetota bacterium]